MKKLFLAIAPALVILAATAALAFAAAGDSTYLVPGTTGDGQSPHGGYDTNTRRCSVCHAVHHAKAGGQALLPTSMATGCVYCHIQTFTGYIKVYAGAMGNYTNASSHAHDNAGGVTCNSCHQVHASKAALTGAPYLDKKIIKVAGFQQAPINPSSDSSAVAESKFCSACHRYYYLGYNRTSHVMTDLAGGYTNPGPKSIVDGTQVAWTPSNSCRTCHADGDSDRVPVPPTTIVSSSSFPHFTDGDRFLRSAATSAGSTTDETATVVPSSDGVCLRCHRDGGGVGVGQTW